MCKRYIDGMPLLGTWPAAQACALTGNQTSHALVSVMTPQVFCLFILDLFIFKQREREGEREGEKHPLAASHTPQSGTWPAAQACALTRN